MQYRKLGSLDWDVSVLGFGAMRLPVIENDPGRVDEAEVWNHPQVSLLLSGMSTMQQVRENIACADRSDATLLSEEDLILVNAIREEYRRLVPVPCTNCKYCLPCPNSVEIAEIFEHYNNANIYDNPRAPRFHYSNLSSDQQADNCVECFECEEKCPQGISIVEYLKKAHALLGENR